ncbi:hypothetical protein WA1_31675 [Scytonema hofmannii PCC 7110]|uniref:DUF3368 domain-containing protein n=1 Tax=Scytonema hofmannii PCC 7110 TaxID=128403 RepID=A0A139X3M3_9CYAN|nr:hypothetical protein [Scytonema hofmannii]KYC39298.1 hypothetical protein WA1_31675 [Scytonema hofmannii PCC 7110]
MIVVCDTSPITNLAAIGQLDILQQLYGSIIIPTAVYNEMVKVDKVVPGAVKEAGVVETRFIELCTGVTEEEGDKGTIFETKAEAVRKAETCVRILDNMELSAELDNSI